MNTNAVTNYPYLLLGGGSQNPRICCLWFETSYPELIPLGDLGGRGATPSIYALDISPDKSLIAAGSRPMLDQKKRVIFPSLIRVYSRPDHWSEKFECVRYEIFVQAGLCDLAITNRGELAVACLNGNVLVFSMNEGFHPISQFSGHSGTTFAVRWIDPGRLVSYGSDGILKLWELDNEQPIFETSPCQPLRHGGIAQLALSANRDELYYGSGDGQLYRLRIKTREVHSVPAHSGELCAVAYHPVKNKILTGGLSDALIKGWDPQALQCNEEYKHNAPIYGLIPISESRFCAVDGAERIVVCSFEGGISVESKKIKFSGRSWAGPDLGALAQQISERNLRDRDEASKCAMAMIEKGDEQGALEKIEFLAAKGFGAESAVLHCALSVSYTHLTLPTN